MNEKIRRRTFHRVAAAGVAATAVAGGRVWGANERIRLGFIGVANRGGQLIEAFQTHDDIEVAALCDVSKSTLAAAKKRFNEKAVLFGCSNCDTDKTACHIMPAHWPNIDAL